MKRHRLPLTFLLLLLGTILHAQPKTAVQIYIETYKDIAMEEMRRTGVPASITLAQGILESYAGQSDLVLRSNNHFGIKCKSDWKGESVSHDDDARGECFRKYDSPLDSYRDHSDFLKTRGHYAFLFKLEPTDYEGWAHGLRKAGYATNPKYPQLLIRIIREHNLHDYTLIALGEKKEAEPIWVRAEEIAGSEYTETLSGPSQPAASAPLHASYPDGIFRINETNVVFVPKGTSYLKLAQEHGVSLSRLFEFNDMEPAEVAEADGLVFLQRKRKTGNHSVHIVYEGETLHSIAQEEGMRLESLLELNQLQAGMQPAAGEKLYLDAKAPARPRLKEETEMRAAVLEGEDAPVRLVMHVVQPKETLYSIAKKYAVAQVDVLKWNNLPTAELKTGQQLRINTRTNATN